MFPLRQLAAESLAIDDTAVGIGVTAATVTRDVMMARFTCETAQCRWTCGITAPTAAGAEGSPLMNPGDSLEIVGQPDIRSFRSIRTGGVSAVLRVQYFGTGA